MVIKQIKIGNNGGNEMLCNFRVTLLVVIILLATTSLGGAEFMNQNVLAKSKIRKNSFKQIFNDIKKTLPKELRKCPISVTDIRFLRAGNDSAEDWTVNICQETKVYFVYAYLLKGYYGHIVKPKEEQFVKEKKYWNAAKKDGDEDYWRKALFYVDELEAMNQGSKDEMSNIKK